MTSMTTQFIATLLVTASLAYAQIPKIPKIPQLSVRNTGPGKNPDIPLPTRGAEPPYKVSGRTAAESLRAFGASRASIRTQMQLQENENMELLSRLGGESDLRRQLEEIELFSRATADPVCSMDIDCKDIKNRRFVDGKEFQTLNGTCNNLDYFSWGMAGIQHRRLLENAYDKGTSWKARSKSVTGTKTDPKKLPSPRAISNAVHSTTVDKVGNSEGLSLALFYFMQFIDHDITKTREGEVPRKKDCCKDSKPHRFCNTIVVEQEDDFFNENYCMDSRRSFPVESCGEGKKYQNQVNDLTSYIDASMVYGSSIEEMNELRTGIVGAMKISNNDFMPPAKHPEEQACRTEKPDICFQAGDTRADVHPGLTTYHTLFVREHNRIANQLSDINPLWSDDRIFFETRRIIAAQIQRITFNEMLPSVLDESIMNLFSLSDVYSYDDSIDASLIQAFSIAYRYHHLMPHALRLAKEDENGDVLNMTPVNQELVWMKPGYLIQDKYRGVDEITLGLAANQCPFANGAVNDAARNFLFLDGNGDAFDLASLNIQRGREWGTPSYTEYRSLCLDGDVTYWDDLLDTHSSEDITRLQSVYADPRDIDLWTGLVTEQPYGDSITGPTHSCLVAFQFYIIRHGDRFWHESTNTDTGFTTDQLTEIKKVGLATVMCNNMDITQMRSEVFDTNSAWMDCESFDEINLTAWEDPAAQN